MTTMHIQATDSDSFVDAQRKAREWADKGIELSGAGETSQARLAAMNAEFWLAKMLSIKTKEEIQSQEAALLDKQALGVRRKKRAFREPKAPRDCVPYRRIAEPEMAADQASVMLLSWKRPGA
jgi:hypothetical protein